MKLSLNLRLASSLFTGLAAVFLALPAAAVPTFAGYPAPGGNSASAAGSPPIVAGGRTWTYSGFTPSAYGDLYYGVGQNFVSAVPPGTEAQFNPGHPSISFNNTPNQVLSFNAGLSNLASGIAIFTGQSTVNTTSGAQTVFTRFRLATTDTANNAIALIDPTTVGLSAALGGILHVTSDFKANWQFLASLSSGSGYQSAQSLYDSLQTIQGSALASSISGGFYATAPVPEPQGYLLAIASLGVLGVFARRRKT